jgi:hypothetical protein
LVVVEEVVRVDEFSKKEWSAFESFILKSEALTG